MDEFEDKQAAFERLSDGQIDVLAGVAQYKSSKEIARELGISWHTVDQRLKRAQAILGVGSRFEAARIYHHFKLSGADAPICEPLVYQDSQFPALSAEAIDGLASVDWNQPAPSEDMVLAEPQPAYFAALERQHETPGWLSVLLTAGGQNNLNWVWRSAIMAIVLFLTVVSLAALVNLAELLSRLG